jgi:glycosyltransferase involved in cell wall biosynthesis
MKVLHVISDLAPGRAEHQLRLLVRRLPYDCEIATLAAGGALAAEIRESGIRVHDLPGDGRSPVSELRRLIRRGRFDLVHTHRYAAAVPARLSARLAGVPVVSTEHGDGLQPGHRFYRAGERLGRMTIAVSPAIAGHLLECDVPADRIALIAPGLDPAEFTFNPRLRAAARTRLGIAPGTAVIGGVGRMVPGKRFDRLIRTIGETPGAVLLLVGDGPAHAALQRLAAIEGVADRVVFAGEVAHAREMLCAMDVLAAPADHDVALTVLEGMAAGLPVLYGACPPLEEEAAARRAVDGSQRLTPHDPESLPRALRAELLCLAERRGGRLPVRTVARYDAARTAASVSRLYETIVARRRPHRLRAVAAAAHQPRHAHSNALL